MIQEDRTLTIDWEFWAQPLLGLAEVALLLVAVYLTIHQFTRTRASSYIERFNSKDALESRVAVDHWLEKHDTSRARLEALEQDPALRNHLRRFANLFQELGAAYQFRTAHRKTVRILFDALVVMYWERLCFWIYDYRARADPSLYSRFEYLYREVKSRHQKAAVLPEFVIAYGSLMDPDSLSAALGREVSSHELIPITLHGWVRRWSVAEEVNHDSRRILTTAVFLDLAEEPGAQAGAVLVRVTPEELEQVSAREKNYNRRDLRESVALVGGQSLQAAASAWAFVGSEQHRIGPETPDAVILQEYLERVIRAARRIDPAIETEIRRSVEKSGLRLAIGPYEFVDPVQASLV